ncbi:MAG: hypothetical protein KAU28_01770 [Phycisphaerae bacterium]|nr:hypothetical protein [Phycisphaerae bacterium]
MIPLTNFQRVLIALLVGMHMVTCVRVAVHARRVGRSPVRWFFITFFLTGIPASIFFAYKYFRPRLAPQRGQARPGGASHEPPSRGRAFRCPHCRRLIQPAEVQTRDVITVCPRCHLPIDEVDLA